ncbi:MAG: beta-lactamase family protein [Tannerella sp.]|jgi:CubicO group peptidase (beta-lactamase class C family)|nr:beta-lactamase family protein [Tannerella sp.]
MAEFNSHTYGLIRKFVKGKKNLKFTVGYLFDDDMFIHVFGENGEFANQPPVFYEIGSITKTFTCSLLAKYISDGKMSLNDTINDYITRLPPGYYPDLKRLATHTSGYSALLPFNVWNFVKTVTGALINSGTKNNPLSGSMDFLKMKRIISSTGLEDKDYPYSYSNLGYGILGYILGTVSQKGYWDTMNDFVKHELGLNETCLGITPGKNIHGYDRWNRDSGNWSWNRDDMLVAAGGMSSTARNLLQYTKMTMQEEKKYLKICCRKYAAASKKQDIGLGWELPVNSQIVCKDGGTGCFTSFLGFNTNSKVAVVVLSNYTCLNISKIGLSTIHHLSNKDNYKSK